MPMVGISGAGAPSGGLTILSGYTTPVIPVGVTFGVGYYLAPKFGIRLEARVSLQDCAFIS